MDPHKKPKYPKTLTERPDAKGDQLGLTSFPAALLRAEVPLDPAAREAHGHASRLKHPAHRVVVSPLGRAPDQ